MADRKLTYRASSNLTVTNLHSLASSSTHVTGWESALVDNTTNLDLDILLSGKFTVAAASLANGEIRVWVVPMLDDSTWPGGFDGTESTETTPLDDANGTAAGAILAKAIATDTTGSQVYYFSGVSVAALCGGTLPPKFVVFVTQSTTQNLAASGNQITTKGVYESVN